MKEIKNAPQPLDDEDLGETTGGTFFGMQPPVITMENPIVMKDQLEETICTRCGKVRSVPVGTKNCVCGGRLQKHTKSASGFTVKL